jgi:GAF domain-containing protein
MADGSLGTYFDALYQITLRISSSLDLEHVLAYVTEEAAKAVEVKASSVRLLDPDGQRLEMRAVFGLSQEYLNKGPVFVDRSPVDQQILAGHCSQLTNVATDHLFQYPEAAQREGIVSVASAPLIAHGNPIGVLRVYSSVPKAFTDTEMKFLTAVADLAALCIENARLYQEIRSSYEDTMDTLWGNPRL